ncbi:MAG TPA: RodZ domain-containing protein [Bryobacteraceae bacterium]|jgi:cytoskeletal protein RodZ|nr:RodZ domain-containing protein [Bryobacteraceae bacterium]
MTSIGERLRRQRLQNRQSLEKIATETKIGVRLLEAIEAEQFEKLPGGVFRRSFVLQYARALGVDADEINAELKQLNQFDEPPVNLAPQMTQEREQRLPIGFPIRASMSGIGGSTLGSLIAAVGVMLACALIYSWWQTRHEPPASAKVAPVASETRKPADPKSVDHRAAADHPTSPAPDSDSAKASASPTSSDGAALRVGLSADEKTWISISSDGKNVFANALQAHETKTVEATEKVRLLIGNAGGVEISLNGKPIGPVGPRGQIRVVELTPAGFQIVPRKSSTLEPL